MYTRYMWSPSSLAASSITQCSRTGFARSRTVAVATGRICPPQAIFFLGSDVSMHGLKKNALLRSLVGENQYLDWSRKCQISRSICIFVGFIGITPKNWNYMTFLVINIGTFISQFVLLCPIKIVTSFLGWIKRETRLNGGVRLVV